MGDVSPTVTNRTNRRDLGYCFLCPRKYLTLIQYKSSLHVDSTNLLGEGGGQPKSTTFVRDYGRQ